MSVASGLDPNELADRLISLRRARGLSQDEVAHAVGISRQSVSKWESAQCLPDLERAISLAAFFGVTTDELLLGVRPQSAAPESAVPVPAQPTEAPARPSEVIVEEPPEAPAEPAPEPEAPQEPKPGTPDIKSFLIADLVCTALGFLLFALVEVEFPVSPNNGDAHAPYEYCNLLALGVGLFFALAGFAVFAVGQALNAPKLAPWKSFLRWTGPFLAAYPAYFAFYVVDRHTILGNFSYIVPLIVYGVLLELWHREFRKKST